MYSDRLNRRLMLPQCLENRMLLAAKIGIAVLFKPTEVLSTHDPIQNEDIRKHACRGLFRIMSGRARRSRIGLGKPSVDNNVSPQRLKSQTSPVYGAVFRMFRNGFLVLVFVPLTLYGPSLDSK